MPPGARSSQKRPAMLRIGRSFVRAKAARMSSRDPTGTSAPKPSIRLTRRYAGTAAASCVTAIAAAAAKAARSAWRRPSVVGSGRDRITSEILLRLCRRLTSRLDRAPETRPDRAALGVRGWAARALAEGDDPMRRENAPRLGSGTRGVPHEARLFAASPRVDVPILNGREHALLETADRRRERGIPAHREPFATVQHALAEVERAEAAPEPDVVIRSQ